MLEIQIVHGSGYRDKDNRSYSGFMKYYFTRTVRRLALHRFFLEILPSSDSISFLRASFFPLAASNGGGGGGERAFFLFPSARFLLAARAAPSRATSKCADHLKLGIRARTRMRGHAIFCLGRRLASSRPSVESVLRTMLTVVREPRRRRRSVARRGRSTMSCSVATSLVSA